MKLVDFLIIGGSAAGTTAAEVIRGIKPDATITIITDENHEEYSRVLLPHYIRHKIDRNHLFLKKPEWYRENNIELVASVRAQKLDASKHELVTSDMGTYKYGKLLIAVGGRVIPFEAPGANLGNILYMRTIEDADKIIDAARDAKTAVVVGGGFIGLEFASCFKVNGVSEVTMLVKEPYFWFGKLDHDSSRVLTVTLEKNGVNVITNEEVETFELSSNPKEGRTLEEVVGTVKTKSGKILKADVVGVGVGIKSDLGWLKGSGLEIEGAIKTNEYLETNLADVYAAGDCAQFHDLIFEREHIIGNWANATSQGNAVGKTMSGERNVFETASSYSISFFDPAVGGTCSFIGVTEEKFADEIISRGSVESGKMTRIFIKTIGNVMRIVGATVINNAAEVGSLTSVVKNRIDITSKKINLSDSSFDLLNLIQQ